MGFSEVVCARVDVEKMSDTEELGLVDTVRRDLARYNRAGKSLGVAMATALYTHPAFLGLLFYRLARHLQASRRTLIAKPIYWVLRVLHPIVRIYSGVEVHPRCVIGPGAYFGHFGPIVIHPNTVIGEQVTIMHGVTLGQTRGGGAPNIGARVSIGASASLLGPIEVGDYCVVAAGATVVTDVAAGSVVGGVPARKIGERSPDEYDEVTGA